MTWLTEGADVRCPACRRMYFVVGPGSLARVSRRTGHITPPAIELRCRCGAEVQVQVLVSQPCARCVDKAA